MYYGQNFIESVDLVGVVVLRVTRQGIGYNDVIGTTMDERKYRHNNSTGVISFKSAQFENPTIDQLEYIDVIFKG